MADEVPAPAQAAPVQPAPAVALVAAVAPPTAAPAAPTQPVIASRPGEASPPVPAPNPDGASPAREVPSGEASLLSEAPKAAEATDAKPEVKPEAKSEDVKPEAEAKPAEIAYQEFKFPEGFKTDAEGIGKFQEIARKNGLTQENAQGFVDLFIEQTKGLPEQIAKQITDQWTDTFQKQTADWKREFTDDPFIGKNQANTTLNDARWAIEKLGGSPEQVKALWGLLSATGAGNNIHMIRAFANAARVMREAAPPLPSHPRQMAKTGAAGRYPMMENGNGDR